MKIKVIIGKIDEDAVDEVLAPILERIILDIKAKQLQKSERGVNEQRRK